MSVALDLRDHIEQPAAVAEFSIPVEVKKSSKYEIHQKLQPYLEDIQRDIQSKFSFRNITTLTLKHCFREAKQRPIFSICKVAFTALCIYGLRNFVIGILAGEVLLKNVGVWDLFSNNIDIQNNAGGLITNAVQDVQFAKDGILIIGSVTYLLFSSAYREARKEIIEECFKKCLGDEAVPREISNELFKIKERMLG